MKHQQATGHATQEVAKKKNKATAKPQGNGPVEQQAGTGDDGRIEVIRRTAYSFYEARSFEGGHELEDWLQAEAQVNRMSQKSMRSPEGSGQAA